MTAVEAIRRAQRAKSVRESVRLYREATRRLDGASERLRRAIDRAGRARTLDEGGEEWATMVLDAAAGER